MGKVIIDPLTLHLLQDAKSLITMKWKSTIVPTFIEWITKKEIKQLEDLVQINIYHSRCIRGNE